MALIPATTVPRRLDASCVTNFYPILFGERKEPNDLHIRIFHCFFHDVDAEETLKPREETELKRRIFEHPRHEGRHRAIEDALGVRGLEFGGDCAAGLVTVWPRSAADPSLGAAGAASGGAAGAASGSGSSASSGAPSPPTNPLADPRPAEIAVDDVDRYEANHGGDWLPAVVRSILDAYTVTVELYAPGSFWSEGLNTSGPFEVAAANIRPRCWDVYRGEVLRVPNHETLVLHPGQHLRVRPRGPGGDEPAGRLALGLGAGVHCEGGTIVNDGLLECRVALQHPLHGQQQYRFEVEAIKTLLVACREGVPELPVEERGVVLQCFTWIFERAYRRMQMRTLGGRGWYLADEATTYPRAREGRAPPLARVFLYRGYSTTPVQVARGPCLKVDLSMRMVQGKTALAKLSFFRDLLIDQRRSAGLSPPTMEDMDSFLASHMAGRTCMTMHNHVHYRIQHVCVDMDVTSTFPFEDGEISYLEYFQRRHGITLQRRQPLLHCPFKGKQELYLPSEIAILTGMDDAWNSNREFAQELWRDLRQEPAEHWRMQSRLTSGLASEDQGCALREWGVSVDTQPLRVGCCELAHEPVYYSRYVDHYFRRARLPPVDFEIPTSKTGFELKPWPEIWTLPGAKLHFDRWLIFCSSRRDDRAAVARWIDELEPIVGEVLEGDLHSERIVIVPPHVAEVPHDNPDGWAEFVKSYQPPWPPSETKFIVVVIPNGTRKRDTFYYRLKNLFNFEFLEAQGDRPFVSQMIMGATLRRPQQRVQMWRNVLQQMLMKRGAWLWVISPLPYLGRAAMVVGIDTCRQSKDSPLLHTLCASTNPYFTTYYTTWRATDAPEVKGGKTGPEPEVPPASLLADAAHNYFRHNQRLPDTIVVYRSGVSESQESLVLEQEVHGAEGLLQKLDRVAREVPWEESEVDAWRQRLEVAYVLVRRGTNSRFCTETRENVPSGTVVDEEVVSRRQDMPGDDAREQRCFEFYMVSQTFVIGTAKPTLYSVIYNTLSMSKFEIMQLSYRLCAVYQTFAGMVSMPAPLKYAAKLLSLLSKCTGTPPAPTPEFNDILRCLFFV